METFNAKQTAKEILKNLNGLKVSTGVTIEVGLQNSELTKLTVNNHFNGYDAVRKAINRQTEKFYDELCILKIGDVIVNFKGGKFSNSLLKMLERCTTEFFNDGNHLENDANFKQNLSIVKNTFINPKITIVDLVPIAAQFEGLNRKQLANLGEQLANHDNFAKEIERYQLAKIEEAQNLEIEISE